MTDGFLPSADDPLLRQLGLAAWRWDPATGLQLSRAARALLSMPETQGDPLAWLEAHLEPADWQAALQQLQRLSTAEDCVTHHLCLNLEPGRQRWLRAVARLCSDTPHNESLPAVQGLLLDVSAQADGEQTGGEQRLAHYDRLTRMPNRYLIQERLQHSLQRAQRHGQRLAVILLDIDSFKNVNDSLGHITGDKLLRVTAKRLQAVVGDGCPVGRVGGDEFLLLIEELDSVDIATQMAEQIIGAMRAPIPVNDREITVTASIGISLFPEDGQNAESLISYADSAMYSAKEQGRDTFRFYSQRMTRSAFRHVLLDTSLREAISRDELCLTYQPQVSLSDGRLTGLECLLRWHHPRLGSMGPGSFIPHAERTGLIRSIGRWALETACRQGRRWLDQGIDFGLLAVNVSPPHFRTPDFVEMVKDVLADTGLPADRLELEITESVLIKDTEELLARMEALRQLGLRFAIDDFGTGYSSLSYLKRMPISRLKLDRSFVTDLASDENDRIIAQAVIALGRALGIRVLAEGVERNEQRDLLQQMGCDEAQGFRFSMPLYAEKIEPILRRQQGVLPDTGSD